MNVAPSMLAGLCLAAPLVLPLSALATDMPTSGSASALPSETRAAQLGRLDSLLAAGDSAAVAAFLRRLGPEMDEDERLAFDAIYRLLGRRAFPEARDLWNRVGRRIQESVRGAWRAPGNVPARLGLGVSLYSVGQLAAAEKELEDVLRRAPGTPRAHFYLGAVLFEQKRSDEARAHLERELALDPRCYGCMAKLAHVAYLKGDDRQCESWLAKAVALEPGYLETNLG